MKRIASREVDGLGEPGSAAVAAGAVDYGGQQLDTVLDDLTVAAAGHWEVWVAGSPPEPLLTPDGTDWIYVKVD